MHIKNHIDKKHTSRSFNETYVKEKIICIKKNLHIVANSDDERISKVVEKQ